MDAANTAAAAAKLAAAQLVAAETASGIDAAEREAVPAGTIPCETSVGSYVSDTDYCFICGKSGVSRKMGFFFADDDSGELGYCWNSQNCAPNCANFKGVGGRIDGECGDPCDNFSETWSGMLQSF